MPIRSKLPGGKEFATLASVNALEMQRRLLALGKKPGRGAITNALRSGARIVRDEARRVAPRETGTLKKSITTRTLPQGQTGPTRHAVLVGIKHDPNARPSPPPRSPAVYGVILEYGGRNNTFSRPGWFTSAYETRKRPAAREIETELAKRIEAAARVLAAGGG